jgi:glycosyltransferase involved in cell wall biosynthesis
MRIVYLISHLEHAGPVNALHGVLHGLLEARLVEPQDVSVVTLSPERPRSRWNEFRALGISLICVPVSPRRLLGGVVALRHKLRELDPDVCHSVNVKADTLLLLAGRGMRFRRVTTVQNVPSEDLQYLYPGVRGRLAARLHYTALAHLRAHVVCCSGTVAWDLRAHTGVEASVILNPLEAPPAPRMVAPRVLQRVVTASAITDRKNVHRLLELFSASSACALLELAVFGEGPRKTELMERYRSDRVLWLGYTHALADEFRCSGVYVSASLSEGLPLAPQLALLCGCPCVLSDIPQHREIASLSPAVFLFDPMSQPSFDAAIGRALVAHAVAADGSRDVLADRLSARTAAKAYMAKYQEALRGTDAAALRPAA